MEPLRTKPVYHHPIPWQTIAALALIGLDVLVRAATAVLTFALTSALDVVPAAATAVLASSVLAILVTLMWIALGVCIAARLDRARNLAMWFSLLNIITAMLLAFAFVPLWEITASAVASGAFSLCLLFLLGGDASKAYTYRAGLRSLEE